MPKLIRIIDGQFVGADDPFTHVADDEGMPLGDVIVSLTRFSTEGDALISQGRAVGVRIEPDEEVEALAYDLPKLAVVAVAFPKYRDGRGFSTAHLLRSRFGFKGEIRAVGEVLREEANFLTRCGCDSFETADGSSPQQWAHAANRHRHVYQRAADRRTPAFTERAES